MTWRSYLMGFLLAIAVLTATNTGLFVGVLISCACYYAAYKVDHKWLMPHEKEKELDGT